VARPEERRGHAVTDPRPGASYEGNSKKGTLPADLADETKGATVAGSSTEGIKIVLHPVSDMAKSKAVYTALLGAPPQADSSYYVGYDAAGQHIGLVPGGGPQAMASPVAYWSVQDIEAKLAEVTAAGATVKDAPRDVGNGRLVATFTDPDGNVLGLVQDS